MHVHRKVPRLEARSFVRKGVLLLLCVCLAETQLLRTSPPTTLHQYTHLPGL